MAPQHLTLPASRDEKESPRLPSDIIPSFSPLSSTFFDLDDNVLSSSSFPSLARQPQYTADSDDSDEEDEGNRGGDVEDDEGLLDEEATIDEGAQEGTWSSLREGIAKIIDTTSYGGSGSSTGASSATTSATSQSESETDDEDDDLLIDFEDLTDSLITSTPKLLSSSFLYTLTIPPASPMSPPTTLLLKSFPRTSTELFLLLELNHISLRSDPWNPSPHIFRAVERHDRVFLFFEPLLAQDTPRMNRAWSWVDWARQLMQGVSFLHEHRIVHRALNLSSSDEMAHNGGHGLVLMDLGLGLNGTFVENWDVQKFDREMRPAKYYISSFAKAMDECEDPKKYSRDIMDLGKRLDKTFSSNLGSNHPAYMPLKHLFLTEMFGGRITSMTEALRRFDEIVMRGITSRSLRTIVPVQSSTSLLSKFAAMRRTNSRNNNLPLIASVLSSSPSSSKTLVEEEPEHAGTLGIGEFDASTLTLVAPPSLRAKRSQDTLREMPRSSVIAEV